MNCLLAAENERKIMITLVLPESFGTNSMAGIIFDKFLANCANNHDAIIEALKQGFVVQIGFRNWSQLIFIGEETKRFLEFAFKDYGVRVDMTFV
jgi:hypothetical protein